MNRKGLTTDNSRLSSRQGAFIQGRGCPRNCPMRALSRDPGRINGKTGRLLHAMTWVPNRGEVPLRALDGGLRSSAVRCRSSHRTICRIDSGLAVRAAERRSLCDCRRNCGGCTRGSLLGECYDSSEQEREQRNDSDKIHFGSI